MTRRWTATTAALAVVATIVLVGEPSVDPVPGGAADDRLGGDSTVVDVTRDAFSRPLPRLSIPERRRFQLGDAVFSQSWVAAPASVTSRDGLGPLFHARACAGCHVRDGRGAPELAPGRAAAALVVRLARPDGTGDPSYGRALAPEAISGVPPEGVAHLRPVASTGAYTDGARYDLRRFEVELRELGYGPLDPDTRATLRLAPAVFGVGLLEAISPGAILARADPDDRDGDGVSGRARWVTDVRTRARALGRFGWKAGAPTVEAQATSAFADDVGITSVLRPTTEYGPTQHAAQRAPSGGSPELDPDQLGDLVFYLRSLAVPAARRSAARSRGARSFAAIGCAACHTPDHTTDTDAAHPALADQRIHPYTDLLLHDLGSELADPYPEGDAGGSEWRTPPLWGLGLTPAVDGHRFLLHDGRARSIEEAILWHGGEARAARERFRALPRAEREGLLEFLESR